MLRHAESRYIDNCSILKMYSMNKYKLVTLKNSIRVAGYEEEKSILYDVKNENKNNRNINEEKLDNSISRTRSKIYEYAICNDFEYFVTLTLNSEKMDRSNIDEYIKN